MALLKNGILGVPGSDENVTTVNDKMANFARSQLKNPSEGKVLYQQGIKDNWCWRPMAYASQNFRAFYTLQLFNARASLTAEAIRKAVEAECVTRRFFKTITTVVSFGCGPGSDLRGLKMFLEEAFPYSARRGSLRESQRFVGYDSVLGWMPFLQNLGYDFECVQINESYLRDMERVDVILMSYSTKEVFREFGKSEEGNTLWKDLRNKARFVLVVDKEDSLSSVIPSKKEYKHFTLEDSTGNAATVYCSYVEND